MQGALDVVDGWIYIYIYIPTSNCYSLLLFLGLSLCPLLLLFSLRWNSMSGSYF